MNAPLAYRIHASLLVSARQRARQFSTATRDVQLDADQIDLAVDYAADARKDAWTHLHAAKRFKLIADFNRSGMAYGRYFDKTLGVVVAS